MSLLEDLKGITRKGSIELKKEEELQKKLDRKSKKVKREKFAQQTIDWLSIKSKEVAKDQNFLHVLRVDWVQDLNEKEYNPDTKKLSGASKIVYDFCKKEKLNPEVVEIWGDDGMGQDELKGYDLKISW